MATIREKQNDFTKVQVCIANWARAGVEMEKAGQEYTNKYSLYKKGQKIVFESVVKKNYGIIKRVLFDRHSQLEGMAEIHITPYKQDFSSPISRQANVIIKDKEIFKTIEILD